MGKSGRGIPFRGSVSATIRRTENASVAVSPPENKKPILSTRRPTSLDDSSSKTILIHASLSPSESWWHTH